MKGQNRNLIIIGNGFDRWQGLPTSYDNFKQYYSKNVLSISKKLGIRVYRNDSAVDLYLKLTQDLRVKLTHL